MRPGDLAERRMPPLCVNTPTATFFHLKLSFFRNPHAPRFMRPKEVARPGPGRGPCLRPNSAGRAPSWWAGRHRCRASHRRRQGRASLRYAHTTGGGAKVPEMAVHRSLRGPARRGVRTFAIIASANSTPRSDLAAARSGRAPAGPRGSCRARSGFLRPSADRPDRNHASTRPRRSPEFRTSGRAAPCSAGQDSRKARRRLSKTGCSR
jgi:hypothetical protein